jgi:hypothetical protein
VPFGCNEFEFEFKLENRANFDGKCKLRNTKRLSENRDTVNRMNRDPENRMLIPREERRNKKLAIVRGRTRTYAEIFQLTSSPERIKAIHENGAVYFGIQFT